MFYHDLLATTRAFNESRMCHVGERDCRPYQVMTRTMNSAEHDLMVELSITITLLTQLNISNLLRGEGLDDLKDDMMIVKSPLPHTLQYRLGG